MTSDGVRAARGLFVTGTDTGVGKTLVAAGLLRLARRQGLVPIPFKPVETGCDPEPADARRLWRAAQPPIPPDDVCLHALPLPAAPALAAAAAGRRIDLGAIVERAQALAAARRLPGRRGSRRPAGPVCRRADDRRSRRPPRAAAAGRRTDGARHHQPRRADPGRGRPAGLPVAGCILSRTEPEIGAHENGNVELIAALTGRRPLGVVPHLDAAARDDDDRVADAVRDSLGDGLRLLLG